MDAAGGGQGGGWEATGAGGSEGPSDAGTGSAGAAGGCLPCTTTCMPVPRIIVPVACQGMTEEAVAATAAAEAAEATLADGNESDATSSTLADGSEWACKSCQTRCC